MADRPRQGTAGQHRDDHGTKGQPDRIGDRLAESRQCKHVAKAGAVVGESTRCEHEEGPQNQDRQRDDEKEAHSPIGGDTSRGHRSATQHSVDVATKLLLFRSQNAIKQRFIRVDFEASRYLF
jgi:hypothetical protein